MSIASHLMGKVVLVRTYSAGVHFGVLRYKVKDQVVLDNCRRIWQWEGAYTCSEIAKYGIDKDGSRVATPIDGHYLAGVIELLPVTPEAAERLYACFWDMCGGL